MNKAMLSPSIMCVDEWSGAKATLDALRAGKIEFLHADVMDGEFVPNLMLGTESVRRLRGAGIPLDIHLMILRPEDKIGWFDPQPGEFVSVHAESTRHLQRALSRVRDFGAKPMAALNPATPLCMIEDVLGDVDGVLIMTVNPGFAGQKLVPQTLDKIRRLRAMPDGAGLEKTRIEVDGNVSFENAVKMRAAGADMFVCGTSSLFCKGTSLPENIARLRRCLAEGEERRSI